MFLDEKRFGEPQQSPLKGFIHTLRHPETWPDGFKWNYGNCDQCAMGLAFKMGFVFTPHSKNMAEAFGITHAQSHDIFIQGNLSWFARPRTRPDQIARTLEKLVPSVESRSVSCKHMTVGPGSPNMAFRLLWH